MTQPVEHRPEGSWRAHPILSGLLRTAIFMIPIASALGSTWIVRSLIASPTDPFGWALWWGLLLALGVIVAMGVERLARRLVPLATLLKLSMLFPDRAPSRFRVARKAGTLNHLESLQASSGDAGDSATQILTLVTALSSHDKHTRGHAERVRVFTDMLSEELDLPERDRYRLRWASLLHDIGKLTIDPAVLNKSSKLNEQQWALIREHPTEGVRIAGPLVEWLGPWGQAIAHHHERFDGTGYPAGLAGEEISLGGRIVSVADAYDTMTSARSYQKPRATAAARRELVAHAGTQFDAAIVRAFLAISLPRLLWATGPLSLAVHLPFLSQLQQIGQTSLTAATQTATVTAVAGVTAMGLVSGPAMAKTDRPVGRVRTEIVAASMASDTQSDGSTDHPARTGKDAHVDVDGTVGHPDGEPGSDSSDTGASSETETSTDEERAPTTSSAGDERTDSDDGPSSDPGTGPDEGPGNSGSGSGKSGSGSGSSGSGSGNSGQGSGSSQGSSSHRAARALHLIARLRAFVIGSGVDDDTIDKLTDRLDNAAEEIDDGRLHHAIHRIEQFIEKVRDARDDHEIGEPTEDSWIAKADEIRALLDA